MVAGRGAASIGSGRADHRRELVQFRARWVFATRSHAVSNSPRRATVNLPGVLAASDRVCEERQNSEDGRGRPADHDLGCATTGVVGFRFARGRQPIQTRTCRVRARKGLDDRDIAQQPGALCGSVIARSIGSGEACLPASISETSEADGEVSGGRPPGIYRRNNASNKRVTLRRWFAALHELVRGARFGFASVVRLGYSTVPATSSRASKSTVAVDGPLSRSLRWRRKPVIGAAPAG